MRSRNIKPGFFENEDLHELPISARLMFIGMWCMADREGRMEDRPKKIKLQLMPYDDIDADELLSSLAASGFIVRYSVNGCRFIQIENFLKHQHPHPNEKPSVMPAPETATMESRLDLATALLDERITEDEAGMDKGEAESIIVNSTSHLGLKCLTPRSEALQTKALHTQADSLIPDSLYTEEKIETPNGVSARNRSDDSGSGPSKRIKPNGIGWEGISEQDRDTWSRAYPAVDIDLELSKAFAWHTANPTKTKRNWHRFLTNWLARCQERGGSCKTGRTKSKAPPSDPEYQPCQYRDISQDIDPEEARAYEEQNNSWS